MKTVVKNDAYWLEQARKQAEAQKKWRSKPENAAKMKQANKRWREKPENAARMKEKRTQYNRERYANMKAAKARLAAKQNNS
jgi:3-oxoacyl-[acyl-carrier-protein] synthase III